MMKCVEIKRIIHISQKVFNNFFHFEVICDLFNTVTCKGVCVTYETGFVLDDWVYCTLYIHTTPDYRQL
jgi:hypothetical protein